MHFHKQIHDYLLNYRNNYNSNFNFLVRQRSNPDDKDYPGGKIPYGLYFQGTDEYCFAGLIDKNAGNTSTRSVGLVFQPSGDNYKLTFDIIFRKETNQKLVKFYKDLASKFENIQWDDKGTKAVLDVCEFPKDDPTKLYKWLDDNYSKIRNLALESGVEKLIPDDKRFQKLQNNLVKKINESSVSINYWLFQANPKIFDFEAAIADDSLDDFTVSAHKDKIKTGDKVILWLSGKKAGCYALAEVTSEPQKVTVSRDDKHWKIKDPNDIKAGIKITHHLFENPILWDEIKNLEEFSNFNAGNQGSNFSATESEYKFMLDLAKKKSKKQYWIYAPGESALQWEEFYDKGIMGLGWDEIGDLNQYENRSEIKKALDRFYGGSGSKKNNVTANDEFLNKIQIGDIVIVKKGRGRLLGYGIVTSNYRFDDNRNEYKHIRNVEWKLKGDWKVDFSLALKTLTDITKYSSDNPAYNTYSEELMGIMESKSTFIKINNERMMSDNNQFNFSLNTILFGPPGTGKTYKLQSKYFNQFTQYKNTTTKEDYLVNQMETLAWWQVLFVALLDLEKVGVNKILAHPAVQAKAKSTSIKNLQASIWGALQRHTKEDCPHVNVTSRAVIKPFWKTEDSLWQLYSNDELDLFPEAKTILEKYKNYEQSSGQEIKNYAFVTFHQSFTYEDFVEGIKPVLEDENEDLSYEISDGIFKKLALKAKNDPDNNYAIFIDEINRGNVASIFGELITLIEDDKREGAENELSVILPYSKTKFSVPQNLYIIGTMNTADRSIEALDSALRRRFEFEEMLPDYDLIDEFLGDKNEFEGYKLSEILKTINDRITVLINRDHQIGHSYFLKLRSSENIKEDLKTVFTKSIIPLLQEYFFNDYVKIAMVIGEGFLEKDKYSDVKFAQNLGDYDSDYYLNTIYEIKKDIDIDKAIKVLMEKNDG